MFYLVLAITTNKGQKRRLDWNSMRLSFKENLVSKIIKGSMVIHLETSCSRDNYVIVQMLWLMKPKTMKKYVATTRKYKELILALIVDLHVRMRSCIIFGIEVKVLKFLIICIIRLTLKKNYGKNLKSSQSIRCMVTKELKFSP